MTAAHAQPLPYIGFPFRCASDPKVEHQQPDLAAERVRQPEPVTRIGRHNAEVRERNRVLETARKAMELARERVGELERAARAGGR